MIATVDADLECLPKVPLCSVPIPSEDRFRTLVETRGRSVTAMVIDDLPTHSVVDTPSIAERYNVTSQTAHEALVRLAEAGIVVERSFSRRKKGRPRRVFAATELIDLLSTQ